MVRPTKKDHRIGIMISCYQKDIDFFNDHKGTMTFSSYLIEGGYKQAGDNTRDEKRIQEITELKQKINELEKKVSFQETIIGRLSNKPTKAQQGIQTTLDNWWQEKKDSINNYLDKNQVPNWETLFIKAIRDYPGIGWNSSKDVEKYVMERIKFDSENP